MFAYQEVQDSKALHTHPAKPPPKKKDSKPSYTTNMALVKASHMAEPKSRAGKIHSAFLMRGTVRPHVKDLGQGGVKNWGNECIQQAAGRMNTSTAFWF